MTELRANVGRVVACLAVLCGCATEALPLKSEAHPDADAPGTDGATPVQTFAAGKGPAHDTPLPAPLGQPLRFLDDDDVWRYVAPNHPGQLYDAAYFDGRFFVLHGEVETSGKAVLSEINWLSWSRDGLTWDTIVLTEQPYQSYTQLATNGESLLLSGSRHIGRLVDRHVEPIQALEQSWAPAVVLPFPDGYAIARQDDILWMGLDGSLEPVLEQELAQFRAGVARAPGTRSIVTGPFGAFSSTDGRHWESAAAPCTGCNAVGIAFGNDRYLAAESLTLYASDDGGSWRPEDWKPAIKPADTPADELYEDRLARIDFTGGHFVALLTGNNTRLSLDGSNWSNQLEIPLGQIGPAACNGHCYVANGRILRAPVLLQKPQPPANADVNAPYYCAYMWPEIDACPGSECVGATVATCREGVACRRACDTAADCPAPGSGKPTVACSQTQIGGLCFLYCEHGETCPDGMRCEAGSCWYVFDDPHCVAP
jgi:hypothetical protein